MLVHPVWRATTATAGDVTASQDFVKGEFLYGYRVTEDGHRVDLLRRAHELTAISPALYFLNPKDFFNRD